MASTLQKLEDNTISLTITIPYDLVKKTWDEIIEQTSKEVKLSGFRKGKAPKKLVEDNIDKNKIREEVLKKLLTQAYIDAIQEHKIRPIMNPRIHVDKIDDLETKNDWQFSAQTCEAPNIDLGNYKEEIKKITAKSKIIIPGKEEQQPNFDEIMQALMQFVKVNIPGILVNQEADRLLAQTLDEIKSLGLTLEQYLSSTKKTPEDLRADYAKKATSDIGIELVLQKIAETENITVEEKEIDEAILKAKSPEERENLEKNRYMLASILRQQKTLDFIKNL